MPDINITEGRADRSEVTLTASGATTDPATTTAGSDEAPDALVDRLLAPGGVTAVFQPVVRVADGAVVGYEALARAPHLPGVSPATWLDTADQTGRRDEVELACIEAAFAAGPPPDGALLFLNVSPDVALHPHLPGLVNPRTRTVIEVTEHVAVDDYAPLLTALGSLRAHGALVAVDDVGAGYASMAHVLQLSPSFVKIDISLVRGLHQDPRRRALVEALQAFAAAIGAVTIAEGVETEAELRELKALGVDLAQGYLLSRPQEPWAHLAPQARQVLSPDEPAPEPADTDQLAAAIADADDAAAACEVVSRFLAHHGGLLPSIYLEHGGVLRCQSRRGQWLVMDGLHPGSGITGASFADNTEILCADVRADPRYRLAVPGVCSEYAVPLRVGGRAVGVLNVDALAPLLPAHSQLVRTCATLLEQRLGALRAAGSPESTLHRLSRLVPTLAKAATVAELYQATLSAVAELTGFDSGCVWRFDDGAPVVAATHGPHAAAVATLGSGDVSELRTLVSALSSCYSGGTDLSLSVPPTHVLRERGVRGVVLVPIRDGWSLTDMLTVTSATTTSVAADTIEAVEALCLQAGSRVAALRRVEQLEALTPSASEGTAGSAGPSSSGSSRSRATRRPLAPTTPRVGVPSPRGPGSPS